MVLLPDLRPRPAEHVGDGERNDGARYDRPGDAVDREDRLDALDEGVGIAGLEPADALERARHADRFDERLGVVEDAFVVEPDEAAVAVAARRVDLDRLQLA
ncbi:hypothetical protein D3C83_70600 [compost metagenome]